MSHREAEPCSFSGQFSGEERIEDFFSRLGWDAVVTNSDFNRLPSFSKCNFERS